MQYFGCVKLSVQKSDGRWTEGVAVCERALELTDDPEVEGLLSQLRERERRTLSHQSAA